MLNVAEQATGWRPVSEEADDVVLFQAGAMAVAVSERAKLAEDSAVHDATGGQA